MPIVLWAIEPGDGTVSKTDLSILKNADAQRAATNLKKVRRGVVLAHDSDLQNPNTEAFTLEFVSSALSMADKTRMQIVPVSQQSNRKR